MNNRHLQSNIVPTNKQNKHMFRGFSLGSLLPRIRIRWISHIEPFPRLTWETGVVQYHLSVFMFPLRTTFNNISCLCQYSYHLHRLWYLLSWDSNIYYIYLTLKMISLMYQRTPVSVNRIVSIAAPWGTGELLMTLMPLKLMWLWSSQLLNLEYTQWFSVYSRRLITD